MKHKIRENSIRRALKLAVVVIAIIIIVVVVLVVVVVEVVVVVVVVVVGSSSRSRSRSIGDDGCMEGRTGGGGVTCELMAYQTWRVTDLLKW